jgi:hypothetical protein
MLILYKKGIIMLERSLNDIRHIEHQEYMKRFREWKLKQNKLSNIIGHKEQDKELFQRLTKNQGITSL